MYKSIDTRASTGSTEQLLQVRARAQLMILRHTQTLKVVITMLYFLGEAAAVVRFASNHFAYQLARIQQRCADLV